MPCSRLNATWLGAPALGLADRRLHRVGDPVGVQDRLAVEVARRAADGLDQAALGAQEALLVGVEDRHQRHLGNVEALAQQVDADQHVEGAQAQVAQDLDPLDGVDVAVQVAHLDAVVGEVVGELLGHALGQRRDQHALVDRRRARGSPAARRRPGASPAAPRPAGRSGPVGRTSCSTTWPRVLLLVVGRRGRDEDRLAHLASRTPRT